MTLGNIANYIGLPWEAGARGPAAFDCWGLVVDIYAKFKETELPMYPQIDRKDLQRFKGINKVIAGGWKQLDKPAHLCTVGLGNSKRLVHHCGLWVNVGPGGSVLHCYSAGGVVLEPIQAIRSKYSTVQFYGLRNQDS